MTTENLDCPLCGKKNAIKYIESSRDFVPRGGPKGLMGNYNITHSGGFHDADQHAKKCRALKDIKDDRHKAHLIGIKSKGFVFEQKITHRDFLIFEQYQEAFKKHGLVFVVKAKREESKKLAVSAHDNDSHKWITIMSIESSKYPRKMYQEDPGSHYLEVKADDPEKAFDALRDRLICGEAIKIRTDLNVLEVWRWDGKQLVHQKRKPTKANLLAI